MVCEDQRCVCGPDGCPGALGSPCKDTGSMSMDCKEGQCIDGTCQKPE